MPFEGVASSVLRAFGGLRMFLVFWRESLVLRIFRGSGMSQMLLISLAGLF